MDVGPVVGEGVFELVEDVAELQAIEPLTFPEWLNRSVNLFFDILLYVLDVPLLRFFAVFSVFLSACYLLAYLLRTGRRLSR